MSWYGFCVSYVDMKWKHSAGKRRATIAWALVTVMPAMIATSKGKPDDKATRAALRQWGFNAKRRADCPQDATVIRTWPSRNTKPVSARTDLAAMRAVLDTGIFSGIHGNELASITYRRVWDKARYTALAPGEYASPLAKRVYDLRHACVSTWLNGGVPPAQVVFT
jgi:hypothetical protein